MKKLSSVLYKYLLISVGTALIGFSLSCFMAVNDVISGGVSGVSTIINHFTGFPLGLAALILNVPIFVYGIIKLGKSIGIATFYGTVSLSVFIDIFAKFGAFTDDLLLASVFGGVLAGIGHGLVFYVNATTGGVDIVAKVVKSKFRHMQLGKIMLVVDLIIISSAMIIYKNFNIGLYSIISLWVTTYVTDLILEGVNFAKLVFVISDHSNVISKEINTKLSRGATILHGYGSYTGKDKEIILCTIKKNEIPLVKDIIKETDRNAFVLITDVREALGEGFLKHSST